MADILKGIGGIGIGFDSVVEAYESLGAEMRDASRYPPYKILRESANKYRVEVDVAGYDPKDISIKINDMVCRVVVEPKNDKFYDGIERETYMVFLVSRFYYLQETSVKNGVLHMTFLNTHKDKRVMEVDFADVETAIEPPAPIPVPEPPKVIVETPIVEPPKMVEEPKPVPAPVVEVVEVEGPVTVVEPAPMPEPVAMPEPELVTVLPPIETVIEPVKLDVEIKPDQTVVLVNTEDNTRPTTSVAVPAEVPQVVELKVDVLPLVSTISEEPQVHIEIVPVEIVYPNVDVVVVPTSDQTKSDIIVALPPLTVEVLANAGIDPASVVAQAIEEVKPVLPDAPSPDVLVPVVEEGANTAVISPAPEMPSAPVDSVEPELPAAVDVVVPVTEPMVPAVEPIVVVEPEPVAEPVVEEIVADVVVEEPVEVPVEPSPVDVPVADPAPPVEPVVVEPPVEAPAEPEPLVEPVVEPLVPAVEPVQPPIESEPVSPPAIEEMQPLPVEPLPVVHTVEPAPADVAPVPADVVDVAPPEVAETQPVIEQEPQPVVETVVETLEPSVVVEEPVSPPVEPVAEEPAPVEPTPETTIASETPVDVAVPMPEPVVEEPVAVVEPVVEAPEVPPPVEAPVAVEEPAPVEAPTEPVEAVPAEPMPEPVPEPVMPVGEPMPVSEPVSFEEPVSPPVETPPPAETVPADVVVVEPQPAANVVVSFELPAAEPTANT